MPKNPHPPRGGDSSKKPAPPAKADAKKGKKSDPGVKGTPDDKSKGKSKGKKEEILPPPEEPKKPDTRTIIGGASWTGKLPVNMLSEHCQKQKWDKPDYSMNKTPEGFISHVTLSALTNIKTQDRTTLPPFHIHPNYKHLAFQPSALEARHFAATYTLFRVANMRNLHMMMPPTYKDLWKGPFQDMKKEAIAEGNGYMYEADPFKVQQEREDAKAAAAKKKEERDRQRAKEQEKSKSLPGNGMGGGPVRARGWTRAPKVEMGKKTRLGVEKLIRRDAVWNALEVAMEKNTKASIVKELSGLGFRKSHVEEAVDLCKDREEVLEWLLIHVPEDDLPRWSLPEGYIAGIAMASGNLAREAALKRLASAGFASDLCEETLDKARGNEGRAAEMLQNSLLQSGDDDLSSSMETSSLEEHTGDEIWSEEQEMLSSIYGERYMSPSPDICLVELETRTDTKELIKIQFRKPTQQYPNVPPVISVVSKLPAYIRLSIVRQALMQTQSLLGEQMIFNLVDWLEQEIPRVIANPGKLSDVSAAVAAADSGAHSRETQQKTHKRRRRMPAPLQWISGSPRSQKILSQWQEKEKTPAQQRMMAARKSLPAWRLGADIVEAVLDHQVVIISGETGSGKSTQSVQFVLDDMIQKQFGEAANIICTQPRRISALGLADRVADERCGTVGDEVGYSIRGESKITPGATKITFVTTGVLLRRLQTSGGSAEDVVKALADVSHVVIDEVHERSLDTDFLLVLLRDVLKRRRDLKVILMSATLDADVFEQYFHEIGPVGRIEIQGRTFPVTDYYVDDIVRMTGFNGAADDDYNNDGSSQSVAESLRSIGMTINYDLIAETVRHIDYELGSEDGGILIFLPGTLEIDRTLQALRRYSQFHALPLHASLLPVEQRRVFPPAPKGLRKIIAATNVAETSITIEDIVAVIDAGRVKETSFDPANNMVKLQEVWASRAACKQRRGRAGRVRAGKCYKLYTRNAEHKMAERPDPEIRRVPLEQLCLSVRAMGIIDVSGFLKGALTPPDSVAVEGALELLRRIGALDGDQLTALGNHLAMIPADLRCSKLLVYGTLFGCLDACLTIASILTVRSPFLSPREKKEEATAVRTSFGQGQGDLIADFRAFQQWSGLRDKGVSRYELRNWCDQNFLARQGLFDIASNRSQYLSSLKEIGLVPVDYNLSRPNLTYDRHNNNVALIRALIAGSFAPQIARIEFPDTKYASSISGAVALDPEARTIKYFTETPKASQTPEQLDDPNRPPPNTRVFIHPSSTLFHQQAFPSNCNFLSYFNLMSTSKIWIRELTPFNAYALLMFGGEMELDTGGRGLIVDEWIRLKGWARIAALVGRLRGMLDEVLRKRVEAPMIGGGEESREEDVVRVVRRLVELNGLDE